MSPLLHALANARECSQHLRIMEAGGFFGAPLMLSENLGLTHSEIELGRAGTGQPGLEAVMDLVLADRQVHGHVPCPQALPL